MNKTSSPLVLGFPEYRAQTEAFARAAELNSAIIDVHHFPDGESKLTLPQRLPRHVILMRSLDHPNAKLVELILAAGGAKRQGAEKITLVAPYLCYMRQDKAFHPGEVVSQTIIGQCLARDIDGVLTVDAHLHRVHRLSDAIPVEKAVNITATEPMAHFLRDQVEAPFLVGPDGESEQWVAAIAVHDKLDYTVATKQRFGDRKVEISLPDRDFRGRNVVLVDDVASTGQTLLEAARLLNEHEPASISVLVTHALFVGDAEAQLRAAGVGAIWSCDAIPHPTNAAPLADLLASEIRRMI